MSNFDGILNFIEENKESLEKMNQEMIASYGQAPLVWFTVEEAKEIAEKLKDLSEGFFLQTGNIDSRAIEWEICLIEKIEQAKGYIPINNASFMEGKLILPKQAEGKE